MQMLEEVVLVGTGWVAAVVCDAISLWSGRGGPQLGGIWRWA